ncbi:MAG: uncharacterized protein A8A55_1401 [Amphiamblys sp. WSBS2006]|nr:MAG: uncharacterized protein A8A55_1401 [Amphiamblys sp. WSBS2006]
MSKANAALSILLFLFGCDLGVGEENVDAVFEKGAREEAIRKNYWQKSLRGEDKKEHPSLRQRDGLSAPKENGSVEDGGFEINEEILNEVIEEWANSNTKKEDGGDSERESYGVDTPVYDMLEEARVFVFLKEAARHGLLEEAAANGLLEGTEKHFNGQKKFIQPQSTECVIIHPSRKIKPFKTATIVLGVVFGLILLCMFCLIMPKD